MELLLDTVGALDGWVLYVVLGLLVLGESAAVLALFLPGELALMAGGALAASGQASLPLLIAVGVIAAVSGHALGYELGRRYGLALLGWRPLRRYRAAVAGAVELVSRHGGAAVFLGRWMNVGRILVPLLVGAGRMRYRSFLLYNVVGGVAWVVAFVLLGAAAGASIDVVVRVVGQASWWVTAVVIGGIGGIVVWRRRRRRSRHEQVDRLHHVRPPVAAPSVRCGRGA